MNATWGRAPHPGFRLRDPADAPAALEAVQAAGGRVLSHGEFSAGYPYVFFLDPDGHEIEIWYESESSFGSPSRIWRRDFRSSSIRPKDVVQRGRGNPVGIRRVQSRHPRERESIDGDTGWRTLQGRRNARPSRRGG